MGIREDKQITKEIAAKVKVVREKKGLTQAQVAKLAGMDKNSYAKLERGEGKAFAISLVKIYKALGITSEEVMP